MVVVVRVGEHQRGHQPGPRLGRVEQLRWGSGVGEVELQVALDLLIVAVVIFGVIRRPPGGHNR